MEGFIALSIINFSELVNFAEVERMKFHGIKYHGEFMSFMVIKVI